MTSPEHTFVNRKYKDTLFRILFGNPEYKEYTLSLYNALNGTDFTNPDDITVTTLEDALYIHMKNDVAFLLDDRMTLWEHQSTHNPNMPLRGLFYFASIYNSWVSSNGYNLFVPKTIPLPTPQYVVFYNGMEDRPPVEKFRLSDAFIHPAEPGEFEWTATVYNINSGRNDSLLERCESLQGYMFLIERIRENCRTLPKEEAVKEAIKYCIDNNILKTVLLKYESEVFMWGLTEFDEESYKRGMMQLGYEEGRAKGMAEGRAEGKAEGLFQSLRTLMESMPLDAAMNLLKLSPDERARYAAMLEQQNS